ncbi:39S ribosomal protein L42, mitochondrial [Drosophila grimshawi]|uniref:Large ribosomal subunit protein mL42 n=1 Tax=Drosophila grimshawi TaxID=7222 RepID=B4IYJ3_DROGR|nr:39S ribosomal protein L42, mitochondrial [Drosophila grimshawi]EDV97666.1 GH16997 [Drosophila grimshawi]
MSARFYSVCRLFSTNVTKNAINKNAVGGQSLVDSVAVTRNGRTIVAWHPETKFPYEHTKPLPHTVEKQSSEYIKETAMQSAMSAFKNKHPEVARQELMKLTHTTKHRWFPRARDKKAKKTPMDRPYL